MRILYAIQGTGNGHLSRAQDIIPEIKKHADLDIFVSGAQAEVQLNHPIKYKSKGLSFYFGKKGGIDFIQTFSKNSSKYLVKEIKNFPVKDYDFIINDFEPISSWAAKREGVPCVALSHQSALLSKKVPKPKIKDPIGEWILHHYAPANAHISFHFKEYDKNMFTPVIRAAIRNAKSETKDHYTVYLPAYDDRKLVKLLSAYSPIRWQIFSKHTRSPYHLGPISVYPIRGEDFVESMRTARGIVCGAGFETPAEALFLKKKLLVVPMQNQYEQHCNAAALKEMGVPVLRKLKESKLDKLSDWVESKKIIETDYKDVAGLAVTTALEKGEKLNKEK